MKNSKFSEAQIIKILSEQNQGKTVNEICREHGSSQPTFYKLKQIWRFGYAATHQNEGTRKKTFLCANNFFRYELFSGLINSN